jgi:hypothetical protein
VGAFVNIACMEFGSLPLIFLNHPQRFGLVANRGQNVHGEVSGNSAEIGLGVVGEKDSLPAGSFRWRISSRLRLSPATTSSKEVPRLLLNHSRERATAWLSSSVISASSSGVSARVRTADGRHGFE